MDSTSPCCGIILNATYKFPLWVDPMAALIVAMLSYADATGAVKFQNGFDHPEIVKAIDLFRTQIVRMLAEVVAESILVVRDESYFEHASDLHEISSLLSQFTQKHAVLHDWIWRLLWQCGLIYIPRKNSIYHYAWTPKGSRLFNACICYYTIKPKLAQL